MKLSVRTLDGLTFLALVAAAFGLRAIDLDSTALSGREMSLLRHAAFGAHWWGELTGDGRPSMDFYAVGPVYEIALSLWSLVSRDAVWLRLLSAGASALVVGWTYLLAARRASRSWATAAAVLVLVHPYSQDAGRIVSAQALATLLLVVSADFALLWLGSTSGKGRRLAVAFALLALYTHPIAWLYVAFLAAAALFALYRPGLSAKTALLPIGALAVLGAPMLPAVFGRITGAMNCDDMSVPQAMFQWAQVLPFGKGDGSLFWLVFKAMAGWPVPALVTIFGLGIAQGLLGLYGGWRLRFSVLLSLWAIGGALLIDGSVCFFGALDLAPYAPFWLSGVAAGMMGLATSGSKPLRVLGYAAWLTVPTLMISPILFSLM